LFLPWLLASKALAANHWNAHTNVVPLAFYWETIPTKNIE
jgi:hypothetical protein